LELENRDVDQATVLIISNDAEFSHAIIARWKFERNVPAFSLMSADLCPALDSEGFDVAIVGGFGQTALPPVLKALDACGKPVLLVRKADELSPPANHGKSRLIVVERDGMWWDTVVLILNESLITAQAECRIERLQKTNTVLTRDAALGRYILEMRHSLNNALTSVLGNSELLVLEPETLAPLEPKVRAQIDTIRNMALRIHEIMQRFSSLEKEMNIAGKQEASESKAKSHAAGASF
jgi:signal transduction histidine kinase